MTPHQYVRPGFAEGFCRALDIFSVFGQCNTPQTPEDEDNDAFAMSMDVKAVFADFWFAMDQFEQEHAEIIEEKEGTRISTISRNPTAYGTKIRQCGQEDNRRAKTRK